MRLLWGAYTAEILQPLGIRLLYGTYIRKKVTILTNLRYTAAIRCMWIEENSHSDKSLIYGWYKSQTQWRNYLSRPSLSTRLLYGAFTKKKLSTLSNHWYMVDIRRIYSEVTSHSDRPLAYGCCTARVRRRTLTFWPTIRTGIRTR